MSRIGWTTADQALSSATNFALHILVARAVTPSEFGVFAVGFSTYLLAMGTTRALIGKPMMIRFSVASKEDQRDPARTAAGAAIVIGIGLAVAVLFVSFLVPVAWSSGLRAVAVLLPALLLQDTWRFIFFSIRRPAMAALNDFVWAVAQLAAVTFVSLQPEIVSVTNLLYAWGFGALVAALLGALQMRMVPAVFNSKPWLRTHRHLWSRYVPEFWLQSGSGQLVNYGIAAVAGPAALGAIRAAEALLGPLNMFIISAGYVAVPEGSRVYSTKPKLLTLVMISISTVLLIGSLGWMLLMLILPHEVGVMVLGANWEPGVALVVPVGLVVALRGVQVGATSGLQVMAQAHRSLMSYVLVSPVILAAGIGGAWLYGASGAAWGLVGASATAAMVLWTSFSKALTTTPPP